MGYEIISPTIKDDNGVEFRIGDLVSVTANDVTNIGKISNIESMERDQGLTLDVSKKYESNTYYFSLEDVTEIEHVILEG